MELNETIWRPLGRPDLGPTNRISNMIAEIEGRSPGLLTSVRLGPTLIVAADFSGQHKSASHECYSFLVADLAFCWLWDEMRKDLRKEFLHGNRRMEFKSLNDRDRQQALTPFLRAANTIPGLLLSILVDKRIDSLFEDHCERVWQNSLFPQFAKWKPVTREKLLRVVNFCALLVSCLSAVNQDVLIFTDEDDFVANDARVVDATKLVGHIMNHYLRHELRHLRFGSTRCDDGSRSIEDLVAIPDLIAGALTELASHSAIPRRPLMVPISTGLSRKAITILDWFADQEVHTLKRFAIVLDSGKGRSLLYRVLNLSSPNRKSEYLWHRELDKRILLYLPHW